MELDGTDRNIGPSVIPEYTPSVRIFSYNVTEAGSIEGARDEVWVFRLREFSFTDELQGWAD